MWEWAHWLTGRRTRIRAPQHDMAPITPGFTYSGDMEEPSPSDSQSPKQHDQAERTFTPPYAHRMDVVPQSKRT
ncbi:unnamed protein product [Schistocephalus solidus]|uniref:Uncharacterized protein n=1 Tax=Schistocephalus solidus TaxID=70667 RepID=A0A183SSW4_SCHSO|nr:unnamed protein product [Schistocephalus solidus]